MALGNKGAYLKVARQHLIPIHPGRDSWLVQRRSYRLRRHSYLVYDRLCADMMFLWQEVSYAMRGHLCSFAGAKHGVLGYGRFQIP